ncbi:MAG: DNA-directed RNA polymerase subunit omega [Helicobacteraceae bacterium]
MRIENIISKALEQTNNDRYKLSVIVTKRVRQIQNGAKILVEANPKQEELADIALREIAQGLIQISE